jgi:F0F1-type ATP synthase assembly protein I
MADGGSDKSQRPRPPRPGVRPLRMTGASAGLEFTASILAGLFVGWWADRRIGTGPWLLILGTFVGAAAGFYNLYRILTTGQAPPRSRKDGRGPE